MDDNIRKYINSDGRRIKFLETLPTLLFSEGFAGLKNYQRDQIKTSLYADGYFVANSKLLDAMLKIDDFPSKFIAFCVKHDCCSDLAQRIKQAQQRRSRIVHDHRRNESSQGTSQVSNFQNAEAGKSQQSSAAEISLQNAVVGTSLQNKSSNEINEQSINNPPCQGSENANQLKEKDESLQKSSSFEDKNSQNNVSKPINKSKVLVSTSQNFFDCTEVDAYQIIDRNNDENPECLNKATNDSSSCMLVDLKRTVQEEQNTDTSSHYSSSFMLSDSDFQNCNMSSCHEITNLKLNIQKEEKESETYVPSNLSQISIDWNYVSTPLNCPSLGESNIPETEEDFQNFVQGLAELKAEIENQLEEVVVDAELTTRNSMLSSEENLIQANEENNNAKETKQSELRTQMFFSDVTTQVPGNFQQPGYASLSRALRYFKSKFTSLYVHHAGSEVDPPSYITDDTK